MSPIFIIIGVLLLFLLLKSLFSTPKPATPPQKKSAPAKKAAAPRKPNPESDPCWMSVSQIGGDLVKTGQPIYASAVDRVVQLVRERIPGWQVLYFERPRKRDVEVPADIAALPRHRSYKPDQCIGIIDSDGKVYCVDLFTYNITDQNRKNFCKRLAKELGCGCRLYTARLPNSRSEMVERTLGCIISKNIDRADVDQPKPKEDPILIATEDDIDPIPVTVQTYEWEEIDEEE